MCALRPGKGGVTPGANRPLVAAARLKDCRADGCLRASQGPMGMAGRDVHAVLPLEDSALKSQLQITRLTRHQR